MASRDQSAARRFRKKPVEIEAVQWTGTNGNEIVRFLGHALNWRAEGDLLIIPTLEGDHTAQPGDWIIRGLAGEFYPCKPDIFERSYEEC